MLNRVKQFCLSMKIYIFEPNSYLDEMTFSTMDVHSDLLLNLILIH